MTEQELVEKATSKILELFAEYIGENTIPVPIEIVSNISCGSTKTREEAIQKLREYLENWVSKVETSS